MRKLIYICGLSTLLIACGGSGGGNSGQSNNSSTDESPNETQIRTFSSMPPEEYTVNGVTLKPTMSIVVDFVNNMESSDARKMELEVNVTTDGSYEPSAGDFQVHHSITCESFCTSRPHEIMIRRGSNSRNKTRIYSGMTNSNGNLRMVVHYFGFFTQTEYDNIVSGNFSYSVRATQYQSPDDENKVLVSEDYFPGKDQFTDTLGLQYDEHGDHTGEKSSADIKSVAIKINFQGY